MSKTYRVAIADSDQSALQLVNDLLNRLGHHVVVRSASMDCLVQDAASSSIDLVICDIPPESGADAFSRLINRFHDIPVIITSNGVNAEFLESNAAHQVFGVLMKPLREAELAATILVAAQRSHEFNQLRDETSSLRAALDDRKLIEQAKGIVMKKCGFDEASAFHHLQHLARQHRQKIVEIAKGILIAESAFLPTQISSKSASGGMPNESTS
jgi:response regulator NasT